MPARGQSHAFQDSQSPQLLRLRPTPRTLFLALPPSSPESDSVCGSPSPLAMVALRSAARRPTLPGPPAPNDFPSVRSPAAFGSPISNVGPRRDSVPYIRGCRIDWPPDPRESTTQAGLVLGNISVLSEARNRGRVRLCAMLWRAFDKTVAACGCGGRGRPRLYGICIGYLNVDNLERNETGPRLDHCVSRREYCTRSVRRASGFVQTGFPKTEMLPRIIVSEPFVSVTSEQQALNAYVAAQCPCRMRRFKAHAA